MRRRLALAGLVLMIAVGCSTNQASRSEDKRVAGPVFSQSQADGSPQPLMEKMDAIPGLTQFDPKAAFPYGGIHYCGPCAVSNSLAWLAGQGYPNLMVRADEPPAVCQVKLANELASRRYLDTTLDMGTTPADLLAGVSQYIQDRGYGYRRLEYQGWRNRSDKFSTGVETPDLNWVKTGLYGHSAVWLNIGWYRYKKESNRYQRMGGHWVTLVGFGIGENGQPDPNVLVIHDPGVKDQLSQYRNDYIRAVRIGSGTLVEGGERTTGAAGFYTLFGGNLPKEGGNAFGIMDGAVVLEMQDPGGQNPAAGIRQSQSEPPANPAS